MRLRTILLSLVTAGLLSALFVTSALAIPPLPSSFYGRVKFNGANVPDGTLVRALIDSQVCAEGRAQTYQGESVYTVDVRGDETGTAAREGGREGDVIQFEVGGILAEQTGVWHSGTNVELNLTVKNIGTFGAPPPAVTPVPTQTLVRPLEAVTEPKSAARPVVTAPPAAAPAPAAAQSTTSSGASGLIIAIAAVAIGGGVVWLNRRKR